MSFRRGLAVLVLGILLGACGGRSLEEGVGLVIGATRVPAKDDASESAAEAARWRTKQLGPGSWTFHAHGGRIELPKDFEDACAELHEAWSRAAKAFPEDMNLAAFLRSPAADRTVDLGTLPLESREAAEALRSIDAAYAQVVSTARSHGVSAPDDWVER